MTGRWLPLLLSCTLLGCSRAGLRATPPGGQDGVAAVERVVREDFFGAIERFDPDALAAAVTPDFELLEDTLRLDLPGFLRLIEPMKGNVSITYRFSDLRTEVHGNAAWTSYRNRAVVRGQGEDRELEWLETAILQWSDGRWRLDRLQSTPVRPR